MITFGKSEVSIGFKTRATPRSLTALLQSINILALLPTGYCKSLISGLFVATAPLKMNRQQLLFRLPFMEHNRRDKIEGARGMGISAATVKESTDIMN